MLKTGYLEHFWVLFCFLGVLSLKLEHKYYALEEYDLSIEIYNKLISLNDKMTNLFKPIALMQIGTISNKHGKHEIALDNFEAA